MLSSKVDVHSVKVPDGSLQCIILGAKTAKLPILVTSRTAMYLEIICVEHDNEYFIRVVFRKELLST